MKKIKLELESLTVETFSVEPGGSAPRAGTVEAHADTEAGVETCDATCPNTCHFSCEYGFNSCPCYPVYETESCGCGPSGIWSCAYTGCGNCNPTPNEAVSCQIRC